MAKGDKLTDKQQMFVENYLVDLNATQAAIRAGYSRKTAAELGYEYLRKPHIQAAIQAEMSKRSQKTGITAEYVLNGIKAVADNTEDDKDKLKAFELLGKHLKLFTDRQEISGEMAVRIVDDLGGGDDDD